MKVLIVGLPLFAKRLRDDLAEFDPSNKYYVLDTYYSKKDRIKAQLLIPRVDVVYSINGTLGTSRAFDLAFKKGKKVMMTWVGTDVTKARRNKSPNKLYLEKAHHYCEVGWIQDELKLVNINAKVLNFFNFKEAKQPSMPAGDQLNILTYISKNREAYYGWAPIMEAATRNPNVKFSVVGTDGEGLDGKPDNVDVLGWVENMDELFEKCHATIRFVEHDGLSGFVLESLYRGKHVIYSEPLEHCHYVTSGEDISRTVEQLQQKCVDNTLSLNEEGISFIHNNFNRSSILTTLIEEMKK